VPLRLGRGEGRDVDLVLSSDPSLSRHALTLTLTPGRSVDVACLQSTGSVSVYRGDGTVAAVLRRGERALLRGSELDVVVYSGAGRVAAMHVVAGSTPPAAPRRPGAAARGSEPRTAARLNVWEVMQPPEGREWLTVAALAGLLTRRVKRTNPFGQPMRKELSGWCGAWFGLETVSAGQLTSWLDKALRAFGLEVEGDKTGVLGEFLVSNGLLSDDELDAVEVELERRRAR